jgi:hypothetical protein
MTTPRINPDSLLLIARRVYPEYAEDWFINERIIKPIRSEVLRKTHNGEYIPFNPRLTGTDRGKAQALDVIVAASKLKNFHLMVWPDGFSIEYTDEYEDERATPLAADILTAALLALEGK